MEYAGASKIHFTAFLEPGIVRNEEIQGRLQGLEDRGLLSISRRKNGSRSVSPEDLDGLLIPSEFWTSAWDRARLSNVRGIFFIEFHQLPYVGTFDVLKAHGRMGTRPTDLVRFPFAASRTFGDPFPLASVQLALCAISVRRANRLRGCRFMAVTPVVNQNLEAAGFAQPAFVPRVPLAVEIDPIHEARNTDEERVYDGAFVGRFHPHKGFLDLPVIAALLKERLGEGLRIAVCGSPSFPRHWHQFQKLVGDLGVGKNLIMLGRVSRSELYRTIRRSRILLYPSYVDGFSITVLESLSLQTPVLAYSIDALRQIWGKRSGVFLEPVGNPHAFAERFLQIRDEGQLDAPGAGLRAQSDRLLTEYNWPAVVAEERRFLEGKPSAVLPGPDMADPMGIAR